MCVGQLKKPADDNVSKFIAVEELTILSISLREAMMGPTREKLLLPGSRGSITNDITPRVHVHLHLDRI